MSKKGQKSQKNAKKRLKTVKNGLKTLKNARKRPKIVKIGQKTQKTCIGPAEKKDYDWPAGGGLCYTVQDFSKCLFAGKEFVMRHFVALKDWPVEELAAMLD
ncbi:MAG: hypothetical protein AB7T27_10320, partial [Kiritimatiellia bacterium]